MSGAKRDRVLMRCVCWAAFGSFAGPGLAAAAMTLRTYARVSRVGDLEGTVIINTVFWGSVGGVVLLPFAFALVCGWAAVSRHLPRMESRLGILLGTLVLAACAYRWYDVSHPSNGGGLPFIHPLIFAAFWIGLALPRFTIPVLRPGVFLDPVGALPSESAA